MDNISTLKASLLAATCLIALALPAKAERVSDNWCNDGIQDSWHFYCDPEPEPEEELLPEPEAASAPPAPEPREEPEEILTARERLAIFSERVEEAKAEAILNPTVENLVAYMRIQKEMIDRAENFQKTWQLALFGTPDLDHNTVYPLTNPGVFDYQDRQRLEREAKLAEISQSHVIMFVTEHPDICYTCETQTGIVRELIDQHATAVFVVSKDGYRYAAFPDAEIDRGQLESLGLADNPTPFFAIIEPATGEVSQIGHGLLTRDQILDRVLRVMEPELIEIASDTPDEEPTDETP
ncbi:protein TraF-like [Amphibalanus amphitrite]|uniref:protein TraF-like n=1 Tax=Amphibalanus amphitrite TaxID=1232801 RepID=UPI001C9255C6|nr:protein TraF-like [Amphibalanus amphitrite]